MTAKPCCGDSGGRTKVGARCGATFGLSAAGLCIVHDPERQQVVRAAQKQGGAAAGVAKRERLAALRAATPTDIPPKPRNLDDAFEFASWLTHAIVAGRIDARTGHEAGYCLARFQSIAEKRELEREIKKLRKDLADARAERQRATA